MHNSSSTEQLPEFNLGMLLLISSGIAVAIFVVLIGGSIVYCRYQDRNFRINVLRAFFNTLQQTQDSELNNQDIENNMNRIPYTASSPVSFPVLRSPITSLSPRSPNAKSPNATSPTARACPNFKSTIGAWR